MIHPRLIEAIAYGDARGLPYETRTREEIRLLGGVAAGLIAPDAHSDFEDFVGYPIGTWSDDTQHACVVAESLAAKGRYDLRDIAFRLKRESKHALGWGKTTKKAVARIRATMTNEELATNGEKVGQGCGPLMRSAPLALYASMRQPQDVDRIAYENAGLTHASPENAVSTVVHHRLIDYLVRAEGDPNAETFIEYAIDWSVVSEQQHGAEPHLSGQLKKMYLAGSEDVAYLEDGKKWAAFTTWVVQAMAYGAFMRRMHEPLEDVVTACIEQGGDTDSTASITASLWTLANPDAGLPQDTKLLAHRDRLLAAQEGLLSVL